MGVYASVTGMDAVNLRIATELNNVKLRTRAGLGSALKHLEEQMDTISPMVPIDTKAMRNSWRIETWEGPYGPMAMAGYQEPYAPFVHENLNAVNWTRPGSGPKWLQIHFDRNILEMKLIIAKSAAVKR